MLDTYSDTLRGKSQKLGIIYMGMGCWELDITYTPGMGEIFWKLRAPQGGHVLEILCGAQNYKWE